MPNEKGEIDKFDLPLSLMEASMILANPDRYSPEQVKAAKEVVEIAQREIDRRQEAYFSQQELRRSQQEARSRMIDNNRERGFNLDEES